MMIVIGTLMVVGGVIALCKICEKGMASARQQVRGDVAAEHERVAACEAVVRTLAEDLGYLLRLAFRPAEIDQLVHTGLSAEKLDATIRERCANVDGVTLGTREITSGDVPVVLPNVLRTRHTYVIGETGSGKTTTLVRWMEQDLLAGNGFALVTPEIDTVQDILGRVPRRRIGDVVLVNPADDCTIPLNPFCLGKGEDPSVAADEIAEVFMALFADAEGNAAPRMDAILRATIHALVHVPGSTLLDAGRLLDRKDASFRKEIVAALADEHAQHFWQDVYPSYPRDAHLPIVTRFSRLLRPTTVRSMLCTKNESFDFRETMDAGRVLLCGLSDGRLGAATARLLGQLVIAKLRLAALRRAELPIAERRLFTLFIDEFSEFTASAASFEQLLARARKYGLGLVAAHQQTSQIPERTLKALLGNCGTIIAFRVGAADARILARELAVNDDGISAAEFASLGKGEAVVRADRTTFRMRTNVLVARGDAGVWLRIRERSQCRVRTDSARPILKLVRAPQTQPNEDPADPFGGAP